MQIHCIIILLKGQPAYTVGLLIVFKYKISYRKGADCMIINNTDLYQFSAYMPHIDLSFHQYLILTDEPILVHTGNVEQARDMLPKLKEVLNGRDLKYIFISHFESDECGGLSLILEHFPNAAPICSQTTAQQLIGFGLIDQAIIKKPGEKLSTSEYELEFFSYPSEMHLWDGLLLMENKRKIFFSSDLMMAFGPGVDEIKKSNWSTEVGNITHEQVPDPIKLAQLQDVLSQLKPNFVATGHGPCIKL